LFFFLLGGPRPSPCRTSVVRVTIKPGVTNMYADTCGLLIDIACIPQAGSLARIPPERRISSTPDRKGPNGGLLYNPR
jgi:hypothetical protein